MLTLVGTAFASAYKSENSNKEVEYSQLPPDNENAVKIELPSPAPSSTSTTQNAKKLLDQPQKEEKKDKIMTQQEAAAHNCQEFKTYLNNLQATEKIKLIDPQGNAVLLTQEQRAAEIEKANEGIKKYCVSQ
jgi:hypothetical protein